MPTSAILLIVGLIYFSSKVITCMDTLFWWAIAFFDLRNGGDIVFNTFIPKEDHLSKRILENHGFS